MGKSRADLPWPVLEDLDDALESMTGQNDHCVTTHVTHVQKYIYISKYSYHILSNKY